MTTIHLILTHEINELFEDFSRGKTESRSNFHQQLPVRHPNEDDEDDFDEYGGPAGGHRHFPR